MNYRVFFVALFMTLSLMVVSWVIGYCVPDQSWMPEGIRDKIDVVEIRTVPIDRQSPHVYHETQVPSGYHVVVIGLDEISLIMTAKEPRPLYHVQINDEEKTCFIFVNMERMGEAILEMIKTIEVQQRDLNGMSEELKDLKSRLQLI